MEGDEKVPRVQERVPETAQHQPALQENGPLGGSHQNIFGGAPGRYAPFDAQAHDPGNKTQQGEILRQELAL